jgi:hypothetical protein
VTVGFDRVRFGMDADKRHECGDVDDLEMTGTQQ